MLIWITRKGATGNDNDEAATGVGYNDKGAFACAGAGDCVEVEGVSSLWQKSVIKMEGHCLLVLRLDRALEMDPR